MEKSVKLIAILTHRVDIAWMALRREGSVAEFSMSEHRGLFTSGRAFKIITDPRQLMGLEIADYRVIGSPSEELIEVARSMLR
jgi:hypothetical protein